MQTMATSSNLRTVASAACESSTETTYRFMLVHDIGSFTEERVRLDLRRTGDRRGCLSASRPFHRETTLGRQRSDLVSVSEWSSRLIRASDLATSARSDENRTKS